MEVLTNEDIKKKFEDWTLGNKGKYTEKEKEFMKLFTRDPVMADRATAFRAGLIIGRLESVNEKL